MNNPVKISCRNLWKVYGDDPGQFFTDSNGDVADTRGLWEKFEAKNHIGAVCNVSFEVRTGEIFVIMGLSGSGKSTVVRCLSRLIEPTAGAMLMDFEDQLTS